MTTTTIARKSRSSSARPSVPAPAPSLPVPESVFRIIAPHGADGRGSVNTGGCQIQIGYLRVIEELFSDPRTPWKTQSDVMRALIADGCERYGPMLRGEVIPGELHQLKMMNDRIAAARRLNDWVESLDSLEREVTRLIDNGMRESAVGLVYAHREDTKRTSDRILRRKLLGDIEQRFSHLLRGEQGRKAGEQRSVQRIEVGAGEDAHDAEAHADADADADADVREDDESGEFDEFVVEN